MIKKTNSMHKKRWKIDIDTIAINLFILVLVLTSLLSLIMVRDYIGYIGYNNAKGGSITEINVVQETPAYLWNGVFGIALQAPLINSSWFIFANPSGMSEINPIFSCLEPGETHELYATTLTNSEIDWTSVVAGTTAFLDSYLNTSPSSYSSATSTFLSTIDVELGSTTISGVPAVYMKQYGVAGSTEFVVGILRYNDTPIMVAVLNDLYVTGYRPDKIFNFEMVVPVPNFAQNLKTYLYTDPYDECPAGQDGDSDIPGDVYGWVLDNATSVPLENALIGLERNIYITAIDGYYEITDLQPGDYYIVAIRDGYINHVSNITIESNVSLEQNISMEEFVEPLTGTGPGIGTGVGPGEDPAGTETETETETGQGPGIGPGIGPFIEKPQELGVDHWLSLEMLKKRIKLNSFFTEHLLIFSFRKDIAKIDLKVSGNVSKILEMSDISAIIEKNQYGNITIRGYGLEKGVYTGSIDISGDFNDSLPVEITVTDEDKIPVEALLMQLDVLTGRPLPGNNFKFKIDLQNLLIDQEYDVRLDYYIRGVESETANNTLYVGNDTIKLITSDSVIKTVLIPPEWAKGEYYLIVEARYMDLYSRTATLFELFEPLYKYKVFGAIELWKILLGLFILAIILGIIIYIRQRMNAQKRFHAKIEYNLLPKKGPRSLYVGKIAETENDTFIDMDKLTVHTIIAGSTGGGKSISAQVIVEEALLKGVAVIVFDPTAQWSGMLRKCVDEKMISFYPRFKMTKKDARAFNGNIRAVKNPREKMDLSKYWKPGEIQVITTSTLDPKDMDIFVANTVREVFHSNLQEFRGLRMMMVYDEVHRLLPKFGGSGEGFIQIERACREFRKWGIGVMLVSQVLADFVGQIKANINTEIQMKTRDEGDLQRIETKYGKSYIQELVKAPVGSGMVQNSDWNRGKPYYITFRPIMHSVVRLTDAELEQYNKYNEMVEDLSYQLEQFELAGKDVFDLKLELKLSLDKIKSGSFNMVEIYLEGLRPRIEKIWKDLGMAPKKRELDLISDTELKTAIDAAKKESDKIKTPEVVLQESKKVLGLNEDVSPDKMLKLANGTLVVKLNALIDELKVLKDDEFKKHVNDDKNDFSFWIRDAIGNDKWADLADPIITKQDYISFLELLSQGKEKTFKVVTPRTKPYSSKPGWTPEVKKEPIKEVPKEEPKPEVKVEETPEAAPEKKPEQKKDEAKPEDEKKVELKVA